MHMALLGPVGLETLSTRVLSSTRMAIDELSSVEGLELAFPKSPVFREFAVKVPGKSSEALSHIFELGVIGGFDLGQWWPDKGSWILIGCDERTSESDISLLKKSLTGLKKFLMLRNHLLSRIDATALDMAPPILRNGHVIIRK